MIFPLWYPFDWTIPPFYELVNISRVIIFSKYSKCSSGNGYLLGYYAAKPGGN
jgi:hypothetical protein